MPSSGVHVDRVTKRFGTAVKALSGLSFEVPQGELFGLIGPDGAGKTTTLRILAGLLTPDEGTAEVDGCDVVQDRVALKHRIGYMPQRFGLYQDLSVDENLRFCAELYELESKGVEERARRLIAACDMTPFRQRLAGNLSGGMKQKLALLAALLHQPRVLLLDEPTTGVDPVSRREFWEILQALQTEGVTVVCSTSYLDEAERFHRVGLLNEGRILVCNTVDELKSSMPGEVLSVDSPNARAVRDALADADGVSAIVMVGEAVHLVVDDAAKRIPEIDGLLKHMTGLPCGPAERIVPSIEDIFAAAIEAERHP